MQLIHWQNPRFLNFGDDINLWLWEKLIPNIEQIAKNDYLLGIGTVLRDNMIPKDNRKVHVIGSGVGYNNFEQALSSGRLNIISVRGPLSAEMLGIEEEKGIIDPAVLISDFDEFKHIEKKDYIAFVPHCESAYMGHWQKACDKAGIKYISPCQDYMTVIKEIAQAKLVIAESMHGAIFADAFRVPWIPVSTSNIILPFKWMDWATSLNLPYEPYVISQSSGFIEAIYKKEADADLNVRQKKYNTHEAKQQLIAMLEHEKNSVSDKKRLGLGLRPKFCYFLNQSWIDKAVSQKRIAIAADALRYISQQTPYLSDNTVLIQKKEQLMEKIQNLPYEIAK